MTKYPGCHDCFGECPGCCAMENNGNTESSKDLLLGSVGWFTFAVISIVYDYVANSLGQR